MKKSFLILVAGFHFFLLPAQPAFIKDSLDKYVEREMKRWNIPGSAVAVVKDGKTVVMKGYGVKDAFAPVSADNKVDENTLFMVASNTKAFTGTALALLEQEKRMSLDDKVTKWLPYFKLNDELASREATVRDMLTHRIGFKTFQSDLLNWNCNGRTRKDLIENMRNVEPVYSFRSQYGYCNAGFLVAGEIVPSVTDTSWDDFIKYRFLLPLKMTRTSTISKSISTDKNTCKPHTIFDDKLTLIPYPVIDNIGPAASMVSTVNDLSNWLIMNLDSGRFEGKKVLPHAAIKAATTPYMLVREMPSASGANFQTYGLGWFLMDYHGKKVVRHDGGADGFVTTTCFVPALNLGIVVLTNTDANSFYAALRTQILDSYLGVPYQNHSERFYRAHFEEKKKEDEEIKSMRELAAKKPAAALKQEDYIGTYRNDVYGEIKIIGQIPENLFGKAKSSPAVKNQPWLTLMFYYHSSLMGKMEPLGGNEFICTYSIPIYGIKKIKFKEENGRVKSVIVRVNDFVDMMEYEFIKEK